MPRPCTCDNFAIGQPFTPGRDCPHCWHYYHHEDYRRHHGGTGALPLHCIHLGDFTGATASCTTCSGNVRIKLRHCALHGTCTETKPVDGYACCQGCGDRQLAGER